MYCKNCGSEVQENQKFCKKCGTPVPKPKELGSVPEIQPTQLIIPVENKEGDKGQKTKNRKNNKAKKICISIVAIFMAVLVLFAVMFFTSPAYSVYGNLEKSNYDTAVKEYKNSVKDNFIQEIFFKVTLKDNRRYDLGILNEFESGKIEFEEALSYLEILNGMGGRSTDETICEINRINRERIIGSLYYHLQQDTDYIKRMISMENKNPNSKSKEIKEKSGEINWIVSALTTVLDECTDSETCGANKSEIEKYIVEITDGIDRTIERLYEDEDSFSPISKETSIELMLSYDRDMNSLCYQIINLYMPSTDDPISLDELKTKCKCETKIYIKN